MISENFVFLAALISLLASSTYIYDTIRGKVKPNRAVWLIVSLAPMLALAGEIDEGVGIRSLITFMSGFLPFLIFLSSFVNKKSYWQLKKLDYACAGIAIIGLILWRVTGEGNVAIALAILSDGIASFPNLPKAFKYPDTENYIAFIGGGVSAVIGLLVIDKWSFASWSFPVYLLTFDIIMVYLVAVRPRKKAPELAT